eukprot:2261455-Alexandrium_andersonii.AAC.1
MSASLVGSEMCIRDRPTSHWHLWFVTFVLLRVPELRRLRARRARGAVFAPKRGLSLIHI